jgi:hypothetical protein
MIYIASPRKAAYIFRMVYFPNENLYDLIPEFKFPTSFAGVGRTWPPPENRAFVRSPVDNLGSAVQTTRFEVQSKSDFEGDGRIFDEYGKRGVRIIQVLGNGGMSWWTLRRPEDPTVGIEDIVL